MNRFNLFYNKGIDIAAKFNINVENIDDCNELADDLIIVGNHSVEKLESLATQLNQNGVLCLAGDYSDLDLNLDVGSIHYKYWRFIGTTSNNIAEAYKTNSRKALKPNGTAWFPGGAGAMGQMHVQLALETENGPKKVVVTDMDDNRLNKLQIRLQPKADANGVEFITMNPKNFKDEEEFTNKLYEISEDGFDDIVMLVQPYECFCRYSRT